MNAVVFVVLIGLAAPAAYQSGPSFDFDLAMAPEAGPAADRANIRGAILLFGSPHLDETERRGLDEHLPRELNA